MTVTQTTLGLSKDEFAALGDAVYDREVLPRVRDEDIRKYVVIDIETGDYEIDSDEIAAGDRLRARRPDGQVWLTRVGSRYARRFTRARSNEQNKIDLESQ